MVSTNLSCVVDILARGSHACVSYFCAPGVATFVAIVGVTCHALRDRYLPACSSLWPWSCVFFLCIRSGHWQFQNSCAMRYATDAICQLASLCRLRFSYVWSHFPCIGRRKGKSVVLCFWASPEAFDGWIESPYLSPRAKRRVQGKFRVPAIVVAVV